MQTNVGVVCSFCTPVQMPQPQYIQQPQQQMQYVQQPQQPVKKISYHKCVNKECGASNPSTQNLCGNCGEVMGRSIGEKIVWYLIVSLISLSCIYSAIGISSPPYTQLLQVSFYMAPLGAILLLILYAEMPIWLGRGLMMNLSTEHEWQLSENYWYRKQLFKWCIRISSALVISVIVSWIIRVVVAVATIASYDGDQFSLTTSVVDTFLSLYFLPVFSFIIGYVEFMFLYSLPEKSTLFNYFSKSPLRRRFWNSIIIFIVGILMLSWSFAGIILPIIPSVIFLLVIQPLILLFSLRELPDKIRTETTRQRQRVVISIYILALITIPMMFNMGLYSSNIANTLEVRIFLDTSVGFMYITVEEVKAVYSSVATMMSVAEMLGIIWAMWAIYRFRGKKDLLNLSITKTHITAIALAGLIFIPLATSSLYGAFNGQKQNMILFDNTIYLATTLNQETLMHQYDIEIEIIVPTNFPLTWEASESTDVSNIELFFVGNTFELNDTYSHIPSKEFFYEMTPCPLNVNQELSIYKLVIHEINTTLPIYELYHDSPPNMHTIPRGLAILWINNEMVTWQGTYGHGYC